MKYLYGKFKIEKLGYVKCMLSTRLGMYIACTMPQNFYKYWYS